MFEGSKDYGVSSQDPLCQSFLKNNVIGDSKTKGEVDNFKVKQLERAYDSILGELIDNAILELCFEVHRAAKLSFPIPNKTKQSTGKSVKSTKESIFCYICKGCKGANKFTGHLYDCMGGSQTNCRRAKTKMINFKECDSEEESDSGTSTKKSKRGKSSKGKSRLLGNSISKLSHNSAPNYMAMSIDERKAFFDVRCGVVTKKSKKLCANTHNCGIHTKAEQTIVRQDLLRDELGNKQIDVDTVETSDIKPSFSACDESMNDYQSGSIPYF